MLIAVLATDEQWTELMKGCDEKKMSRINSLQDNTTADGYIILDERSDAVIHATSKPILVNAVIKTLTELNAAKNVYRINGWRGFIERTTWEIAGTVTEEVKEISRILNKQFIEVADEPGLVAARSIAMIINEAYFALGEDVSTKEEIDIAMKLGTNYPMGPFEWLQKIGVKNIYGLLNVLNNTEKRYLPAALLEKEATA